MVSGTDCLVQSLTLRIGTPYGTDRVNVAYGLESPTHSPAVTAWPW